MSSPTKNAEISFKSANEILEIVFTGMRPSEERNVIEAQRNICWGLISLSTGVRATYQLLEEVQKELQLLSQSRRS